jgi:hypothetical protein
MHIKEFFEIYEPQIFPLHSIQNGICSCKNKDCVAPGKHPYLKFNWKILATNQKSKVIKWFDKYSNQNWAVATGRLLKNTNKYLVVLDIDSQDKDLTDRLPETFFYKTGSGGFHYWFLSEKPIPCKVGLNGKKVDIRGKNGYVVIPPSNHISGSKYEVTKLINKIADLPENFLLENTSLSFEPVVKKKTVTKPIKNGWSELKVPEIKEKINNGIVVPCGTRNIVLHKLLCSERAKGAGGFELRSKAFEILPSLETTFTMQEVSTVIDSVLKYPAYSQNIKEVVRNYNSWLEKKGIKPQYTNEELENIENQFFSSLKKSSRFYCPLTKVKLFRESFYETKGVKNPPNIKPSLFGTLLLAAGFEKRHTEHGNFWNLELLNE